jgi:hypothetical protein
MLPWRVQGYFVDVLHPTPSTDGPIRKVRVLVTFVPSGVVAMPTGVVLRQPTPLAGRLPMSTVVFEFANIVATDELILTGWYYSNLDYFRTVLDMQVDRLQGTYYVPR